MGGGNTAMDCCRTSQRLGAERRDSVVVRSGFEVMKASEWEKEDAMSGGHPHHQQPPAEGIRARERQAQGHRLRMRQAGGRATNGRLKLRSHRRADDVFIPNADHVLMAIGQENHCPWIERDIGLEFDKWDCPILDEDTLQSTNPKVFFGGDSAYSAPRTSSGPRRTPTKAAISMHLFCQGKDLKADRPPEGVNLISTEDGRAPVELRRRARPLGALSSSPTRTTAPSRSGNIKIEVELGFDKRFGPARRRSAASTATCRRCSPTEALHRMRCLRGHLPDGLHHLHRERGGGA